MNIIIDILLTLPSWALFLYFFGLGLLIVKGYYAYKIIREIKKEL